LSKGRLLSNDAKGFAMWDLQSQQQYFYHAVGKNPHDLFEGAKRLRADIRKSRGLVHCTTAVILPKEDWLALTPDPGFPQFLKFDVSDIWPKRCDE